MPHAMRTEPRQLRIAFGADPLTQISITWQTRQPVKNPVVEYGETPNLGRRAVAERVRYPYETGAIYRALLTDLKPGHRYYYRVGSAEGGFSRAYDFRTPRAGLHDFVFTAFADHGTTRYSVRNTRNVLAHNPTFHFIVGDLSYADGRQEVWDTYLEQLEVLAARIPVMVCFGNHENERIGEQRIGYVAAETRFAMPNRGQYYEFTISNARFVAFNSNERKDEQQYAWLERALQRARADRTIRWLIVFAHHPLYGSTRRRGNNQAMIRRFQPLFDRYRVDLVIHGHDHVYERMYPMRNNTAVVKSGTRYKQGAGVVYVTCGGGGASLYDLMPEPTPWTAKREKTYCYLKVRVPAQGALRVEAYRIDNSLIEAFEIE
ncbi:MAG: purple acid phosphatase [Fimbriimonadales bacterium]|nr:purple acid phosphatase [Fimbriimonadales bacterium]MDW8051005.1 metallophosphoesterase family protein [Armatimonadota bacterium]